MHGQSKILLVDDDETFLISLSEGLNEPEAGLKVLTAGNGRQALEVLGSRPEIDLLVTDLRMPEMNGFDLLASLKKDFPATRAIALTALLTPEVEERLKAIGDYVCIEKSAGFGELRRVIMCELRRP
ncbi:MAG: response regulator [Nitrospiraceae bacterium]|nr:response regulator [Nitrospiraceae bacterium]